MARSIILAIKEICTGCAACASICPQSCIHMEEDKEGFLQPKIDNKRCIKCHKCEKTCPILNKETVRNDVETKAYAAINKDETIRAKSSSGGVFHALARWTIEHGGVVFGARFDENWEVMHDYSETLEGVIPFMGSKYVQSRIGDSYKQAESFLEQGRWVLFSGTPCQLGGLRAFLDKEYVRLIQVDLICYGVSSPKVWRGCLKDYERKHGQISNVTFRDKTDGWNHFKCVITTNDGKREKEDGFMKGFFRNYYLRRSCYDCRFRLLHRSSDVTIADYWGVEEYCPKMFDNKGTSIVFTHSNIGNRVLSEIVDKLYLSPQSVDDAKEFNPCMDRKNPILNKRRKNFYCALKIVSFDNALSSTDKHDVGTRIVKKIRKRVTKYVVFLKN